MAFLFFQKFKILVNYSSAHSANSRKFADVELLVFVRGIMFVKNAWDLVFCEVRSTNLNSLCLCVRHSAFYSTSYNSQFQLCENATHRTLSLFFWKVLKSLLLVVLVYKSALLHLYSGLLFLVVSFSPSYQAQTLQSLPQRFCPFYGSS